MIEIKRKEDCVGCEACVQVCPKQCISFNRDDQGFNYPSVDLNLCIDCGLCEKVCPVINQDATRKPLNTYAAFNPNNDVLKNSSSGGIFYSLAEHTIRKGGAVFGAKFDCDWNLVHDYTESLDGIKDFQKSKYVQSSIGESYKQVQCFLKDGRIVLFSGTPCQIAGLRRYLRKDYGNQLILIDTACHGVPSPLIWQDYINCVSQKENYSKKDIISIDFRDKRFGWESYGMSILFRKYSSERDWYSPMYDNLYMRGFLRDLYLRPSCYECPAKCGKSHSDITLADFWGINTLYPELYSDKGVSLVLANTQRGLDILSKLTIILNTVSLKRALNTNPAIEKSACRPKFYDVFWYNYHMNGLIAISTTLVKMKPTLIGRCRNRIKKVLSKLKNY